MADYGKINFSVAFNPVTAFPLDARSYFTSYEDAVSAATTAVTVGSSDGTYYIGETVVVVGDEIATTYVIQPDLTLQAVGSVSTVDNNTIEVVDGVIQIVGANTATEGQVLQMGANGVAEWATVAGTEYTVADNEDIDSIFDDTSEE